MGRADVLSCPNRLPYAERVVVDEFALKVEQEPAVREVEVRVVATVMHVFEKVRVDDLNERSHVGEVLIHRCAMWEVRRHAFH